jgi:hypothetical protein
MNGEFDPRTLRTGSFGKFAVYGTLFQGRGKFEKTQRAWLLTMVEPSTPAHHDIKHDFWISGGEFRRVLRGNLLQSQPGPSSSFDLGEPIADIHQDVSHAASEAIGTWERKLNLDGAGLK